MYERIGFDFFPQVTAVLFKGILLNISPVVLTNIRAVGGEKLKSIIIMNRNFISVAKDFWGSCYGKEYRKCNKNGSEQAF